MSSPISAFGPQHLVGSDNSQPHPASRIYDSEDETGETRRGRFQKGDAPPVREGGFNVIKPKRCFACKAVGHLIAQCPQNPRARNQPPTAQPPAAQPPAAQTPQANRTHQPTKPITPRGGGPQRNPPARAGGAPWHQPYPSPWPQPFQNRPQGGMMGWGAVGAVPWGGMGAGMSPQPGAWGAAPTPPRPSVLQELRGVLAELAAAEAARR